MSYLYDNIRLCATIVSDTHIDIKHPVKIVPMYLLMSALKAAKKSNADAFIIVGDTTSAGSPANWSLVRKCFSRVTDAARIIILTVGNHDGWNDDDSYESAKMQYLSACRDICKRDAEATYFSEIINGYYFISIGSDSASGCEAAISDTQLEWFSAEMEKAGKTEKPVFVFCHQSLNGRHGLPRTWDRHEDPNRAPDEGGIGKRSDEVAAILKKYRNVFYFSGHSHMGLSGEDMLKKEGYCTFENEDGVTLVNLPSLSCGNHHGELQGLGMGLQLEIYDTKVVLRPRSYISGKWIKRLNIRDGRPYYEIQL